MTNDIEQWRREHGVPSYVPWPEGYPNVTASDFVEPNREYVFGIGADDKREINMEYAALRGWQDFDGDLSPWYEAGELYAIARRGANHMRRYAANYVYGKHARTNGATLAELRHGCPVGWME